MIFSTEASLLFLKAPKTAGSSIELWLAREFFGVSTIEGDEHPEISPRVSEKGIMTRISLSRATKFEIRPHISLSSAITLLGQETVDSARLLTCVRNPFDQIFSFFWWRTSVADPKLHARLTRAGQRDIAFHFNRFVKNFDGSWLRQKNFLSCDTPRRSIDHVFRFENLDVDFHSFARDVLGVQSPRPLPRLKMGVKPPGLSYQDFYSTRSRGKIERVMAWEFEHLGYWFDS